MTDSMVPKAEFFNRELSWLQFNRRVLDEGLDGRVPLTERAKFLAIVSSNLDEFVMVRLARLMKDRDEPGRDAAGYAATEQLALVRRAIAEQVEEQYLGYAELVRLFDAHGVSIVSRDAWTQTERLALKATFRESLEPLLTPLAVGPEQPFPLLANLKLHIALRLEQGGAGEEAVRYAILPVPVSERRLIPLGEGRYALLEEVLCHSAEALFPGWRVRAHATFRVTRDGLLDIDEDNATDLLTELEEGLWLRGHGAAVRLELDYATPDDLIDWLRDELELEPEDVILVNGPLDLTFLFAASGLAHTLQARQFPAHRPVASRVDFEDPFAALARGPVLLHHPYDSFDPVVQLLVRAAADPAVVAIKQTLYRVSGDSPLVLALIDAAASGKQVTVLCELRARFDERRNIAWAKRLEQAGATVLYGVLGYKVHAKMLLVVRREEQGIRRYAHIGTGNYNDKTARQYEDLSYLTADEAVCRDLSNLFNMLTGFSQPPTWDRLIVAPITFRKRIQAWIDGEAERARQGKPARIFAKMNSLVDQEVCEHLYRASKAGVRIDLVVRGICILRPGVVGLSDNIRVRSVVGRFLEHSRLYYFQHGGRGVYVVGSGDWMTRNLDRRVESLLEVREPELRSQLDHIMRAYLDDSRSSRELQPDGNYRRLAPPDDMSPGVQERFIQQAEADAAAASLDPNPVAFTPARKPSDDVYG